MKSAWECFRLAAKCGAAAMRTLDQKGRAVLYETARQWRSLGKTALGRRSAAGADAPDGQVWFAGQQAALERGAREVDRARPLDQRLVEIEESGCGGGHARKRTRPTTAFDLAVAERLDRQKDRKSVV